VRKAQRVAVGLVAVPLAVRIVGLRLPGFGLVQKVATPELHE
jgi:hypothetical protein